MTIKKSDLYRSLWSSCDELRGGMDASQYKDYILTLLFVKYVSDKYAGGKSTLIEIPKGGSFADAVALKGDKEIGDKLNKIIGRLAKANGLEGVITEADFNDGDKLGKGKDMQDRLSALLTIFDALDFRASRADGDDLLGDAYEYLMRHFATESGKSKGQFYTPAEVSRVLARVVGLGPDTRKDQTIYDPTCGSGSLLLKAADEAPRGITIYGQEKDGATWALAKMNMILHGHETADLVRDNTIATPGFKTASGVLKTFDFAVANPPFSDKSWRNGINPLKDKFDRFAYGVPPAKNGDYAFLLHVIKSLKSTGHAAVILPHGVLFRANAEATIRKNLIKRGLIKGIIGLPPNLFYGTGIPACVVVIDKASADTRTGIFMIDASRGFVKDGNKNRLRARDLHQIVDVFTNQAVVPGYSRMVPLDEIAGPENDYNLNIPRYIDSSVPEDLHDLSAHLLGGIPDRDIDALHEYWDVLPSLRAKLFGSATRAGYSIAKVSPENVRRTIVEHPEFQVFAALVAKTVQDWAEAHRGHLLELDAGLSPGSVIFELAEDLLLRCADLPLLDRYVAYQRIMSYWADTMQDDLYLISVEGWKNAAMPRVAIEDKSRDIKETPDLILGKTKYKLDLVPPGLIASRYFPDQQRTVEDAVVARDVAVSDLESFVLEHGEEGGLVEDALNEKGAPTKAGVAAAIRTVKDDEESVDEYQALTRLGELMDGVTNATAAVKAAKLELDKQVLAKCSGLDESEVKALVLDSKWFAAITDAIEREANDLARALAARVSELEQRYAVTLPDLGHEAEALEQKVEAHLAAMGQVW